MRCPVDSRVREFDCAADVVFRMFSNDSVFTLFTVSPIVSFPLLLAMFGSI